MIKKIFAVIACLALSLALIGCAPSTTDESEAVEETQSMFVTVEFSGIYEVVYDRETKVMYVMSGGLKNAGNFTMLVNADGSPKLYEEEV